MTDSNEPREDLPEHSEVCDTSRKEREQEKPIAFEKDEVVDEPELSLLEKANKLATDLLEKMILKDERR